MKATVAGASAFRIDREHALGSKNSPPCLKCGKSGPRVSAVDRNVAQSAKEVGHEPAFESTPSKVFGFPEEADRSRRYQGNDCCIEGGPMIECKDHWALAGHILDSPHDRSVKCPSDRAQHETYPKLHQGQLSAAQA
jgi:hypothetical protein